MITQENIPYTADEIKAMVKTCEKYNKALEKARELMDKGYDVLMPEIFPELQEDKDERIRKTIYGWIYTQPSEFFDNGFSKEEMLAWVEKQADKDKLIRELGEYKVKYTQKVLQEDLNKNTESQSQPKFKVGDKVTIEGDDTIYTIYSIDLEEYCWLTYEDRGRGWAKLDSLKHYVE